MCIFLCLSNSCLLQSFRSQEFTKCIFDFYFVECHFFIRDCYIIFCKTDIGYFLAFASVKTIKFICAKSSCDLTSAVRSEVEEDNGITVIDCSRWLAISHNDSRYNKFIVNFLLIGCLNRIIWAFCLYAFTKSDGTISFFYTVPSVVTVHGIVTAHNRSNLSNTQFLHLLV